MNWFDSNSDLQISMKIDNNLDRFKNACIEAGSPHLKMKNIIHVAGTNGKGSTIAFLQAILKEAGFKVNATTSPHLIKFNERINLNGSDISDEQINEVYQKYEYIFNKYDLSFFEKSILIAFLAFSASDADFNIIEVGLGGTLDATNIIENPKICVITAMGLDHCAILGDTIEKIAVSKGDIIKPNAKVVIGYNQESVIEVITKNRNNTFYIGNKDWFVDKTLKISLQGEHQYYNASNAIAVCDLLKTEFDIPKQAIVNGLAKTIWPARMQKINNIIIDGAHNIEGIKELVGYLKNIQDKKIAIMAIMKDKNIDEVCNVIKGVFETIYCVPLLGCMRQRALPPEQLANKLNQNKINAKEVKNLNDLLANLDNKQTTIIFGSLFLAGETLAFYSKKI